MVAPLLHLSHKMLRDLSRRKLAAQNEIPRKIMKTVLKQDPTRMDVRSNLELLPGRPTLVKNRCIITGRGRIVSSKWGMSRHALKDMFEERDPKYLV
eukprot:Clim_evm41s136 gene=Clim_evmTU41s136